MIPRTYLAGVLVVVLLAPPLRGSSDPKWPENPNLSFSLCFKEELSSLPVTVLFAMPGERIELSVCEGAEGSFVLREGGTIHSSRGEGLIWDWESGKAPGLRTLELLRISTGEVMTLNVFTMVPFSAVRDGALNGYRIGTYPAEKLRGLSIYERPKGFVEVTEENQQTQLSPHLRLNQFLCKQPGGFPKYVVLQERLILKLEILLAEANKAGIRAGSFSILSGYRTPYYNKAIGNVRYSRHLWGGAADIFIDEDGDRQMDDLNGDGKIDFYDAEVLRQTFDHLSGLRWYERFLGGLAKYRSNPNHGPFVHVDVRGRRARW